MTNYTEDLEKTSRVLFPFYLFLLVLSPFPLGSNRPWAWILLSIVAFLLVAIYSFQFARGRVRLPEIGVEVKFILFCLTVWIVYQIILIVPLPADLAFKLSPSLKNIITEENSEFINNDYISLSIDKMTSFIEIVKSCLYVCIFTLTVLLVQSKDRLRNLLIAIVITGVLQAVVGVTIAFLDHQTIGGLNYGEYSPVKGTFVNRNHFAGFMNMAIAASIGLVIAVGFREKRQIHRDAHKHHWQSRLLDWRVYMLFYSALMILAMIFSQSRGGWISFCVMTIIGFILLSLAKIKISKIISNYKLPLFIIAVIVLVTAADLIVNRVANIVIDLDIRLDIWGSTMSMIKDFWVTGVGPGNFQYIFPLYDSGYSSTHNVNIVHAHNDYLELITEQGVFGFALLGIVILLSVKNAIISLYREKSIRKAAFAIASVMAMSSLLAHSLFDFNFQIPSNSIYFFVFVAVASLQGAKSVETEKRDIVWDDSVFNGAYDPIIPPRQRRARKAPSHDGNTKIGV